MSGKKTSTNRGDPRLTAPGESITRRLTESIIHGSDATQSCNDGVNLESELPPPPGSPNPLVEKVAAKLQRGRLEGSELPADHPIVPGYRLQSTLGRGGMGVVYLARQTSLHRLVALKMLFPRIRSDPSDAVRFRREALAVAQLHHPGVVQIFDVGECPAGLYYSMEYLPKGSLTDYLGGQPVPAVDAAKFVELVAQAVHFAHEHGIVHRDLKPANILVSAVDDCGPSSAAKAADRERHASLNGTTPKLADFGLAKIVNESTGDTHLRPIVGTPSYMAPEQVNGEGGISADIYAVGALLYEMLTGRPPFLGATHVETLQQVATAQVIAPSKLQPGTPRDVETICLKCLSREPERRYATAQLVADDLERFIRGWPIVARPVGSVEKVWSWCRRNRALAIMSATAAAAAMLLLFATVRFAWERGLMAESLAEENQRAKAAVAIANAQRQHAETLSAQLTMDHGLLLCRQRNAASGLLWLAKSLQMIEGLSVPALDRDIRGNIAGWSGQLRPLIGDFSAFRPGAVQGLTYNDNGTYLAVAAQDGLVRIINLAIGKYRTEVLRHESPVNCVTFVPEGSRLVAGCANGQAYVWNIDHPSAAELILRHNSFVTDVKVSAISRTLAVSCGDGIYLWNVDSGTKFGEFPHDTVVTSVCWHPAEPILASCHIDGSVRLWDIRTMSQHGQTMRHSDAVKAIAFHPDGLRLITAGDDKTLRIWSAAHQTVERSVVTPSRVRCVAFTSDGDRMVTGALDGATDVWDFERLEPIGATCMQQDSVWSLALSPDDGSIAVGGALGAIRLWDIALPGSLRHTLTHEGPIDVVAVSPNGHTAATSGRDGVVHRWDLRDGSPIGAPWRHPAEVVGLVYDHSGTRLLTACEDGTARCLELASEPGREIVFRHDAWLKAALFDPSDTIVATASGDRTVRIWRVDDGAPIGTPLEHRDTVNALAFTRDGTHLVTGTADGKGQLWNIASGTKVGPELAHDGAIISIACNPTGDSFVTGSWDGTASIWRYPTGERVATLQHHGRVLHVAYRPDGQVIATAAADRMARFWNAVTGQIMGRPIQHQGMISTTSFGPDGHLLLTASDDNSAQLWNADTLRPLGPPLRHQNYVRAALFVPRSPYVITGSWDRTVKIWEIGQAWTGRATEVVQRVQRLTGMQLRNEVAEELDTASWRSIPRLPSDYQGEKNSP